MIELGLEPKTHSLEGCCSIQLSYSTEIGRIDKLRKNYQKIGVQSYENIANPQLFDYVCTLGTNVKPHNRL